MYNYQRNEKTARDEKLKACHANVRLWIHGFCAVFVIVLVIAIAMQRQQRKRQELQRLMHDFTTTLRQKRDADAEMEILRQNLLVSDETKQLLHRKETECRTLAARLASAEAEIANLKAIDKRDMLLSSNIVRSFKLRLPTSEPSPAEWEELEENFCLKLPSFYRFIKQEHSLSPQEIQVVLLLYIDLGNKEIAALLGTKPNRISTVKEHLNKKLFGEGGSKSLIFNIKQWEKNRR